MTRHLTAVAQLHDIGKVTVPPEILNKPARSTTWSGASMSRHTIAGEQILELRAGDHAGRTSW